MNFASKGFCQRWVIIEHDPIEIQQPLRITTTLVNILSTKFVSSCAISCRE